MTNEQIKKLIEKEMGIEDISTRTKLRHIVDARTIFYYVCVKYSEDIVTYAKLGKMVNKTHATVMFGYKNFATFYRQETEFRILSNIIIDKVIEKTNKKVVRNFERINNFECEELKKKLKNLQLNLSSQISQKNFYKREYKKLKSINITEN